MKTLPKYFVIKKDKSNPLWEKYINWLNKTYIKFEQQYWNGKILDYYGYDGIESYKGGTNCWNCIDSLNNNPILITLEEWNECVNGFVLPEKWYVQVNKDNQKILSEWRGVNLKLDYVTGIHENGHKEHDCRTDAIKSIEWGVEITFEQFEKYVLMKDKKIIGYKLRDKYIDNKKVHDAAIKIEGGIQFGTRSIHEGHNGEPAIPINGESSIEKLKSADVFDLWFEPVYAPQYSLPKINGYDGIIDQYGILTYGCAKIHNSQLRLILQYNSIGGNKTDATPYRSIKSITLSSGVVITIDEIKQIVEYVDNR